MRIFRSPKKIRVNKLNINNKIFNKAKGETDENLANRITIELKKFDFYDARRLIFELASNFKIPKNLRNIFDQENRYKHFRIESRVSSENYIYWLLGILTANQGLLREFNSLRKTLNTKILKGDSSAALSVLDEIDKLSKSWWADEIRLHIIKELQKGETQEQLQYLSASFSGVNVSRWIFDLSLISESSSIDVYINVINSRFKEIRTSGLEAAIADIAVNSCSGLPISYDTERVLSYSSISNYQDESIIDQYILIRTIICEIYAKEKTVQEDILNLFIDLSECTSDIEMLSFFQSSELTDVFVEKILDDYTSGNYEKVISSIDESIDQENYNYVGLIEIYARSIAYTPNFPRLPSFFNNLATEFSNVLQLAPKSSEKIEYLKKICVKFRAELWAKSLIFHVQKALEVVEQAHAVEASRLQTSGLGNLGTPKARNKDYKPQIKNIASTTIVSPVRMMRYTAVEDISKPLDKSIFLIFSDYLVAKSRHYLDQNDLFASVNFSIDAYLENKASIIFLPIEKLCTLIAKNNSQSRQEIISCLIILDIYSRELDSRNNDLKAELFEEFLSENNTHKPSLIFDLDSINSHKAYFLRHICIPSMLDNIIDFKSYDEVIHERIAIIDTLINSKIPGHENLNREKDKVLENLFSEKLRAKIESGKLFVDVQALEEQRKHVYMSLFEQAKTLEGGVVLEVLDEQDISLKSKDIFEISKDKSGMPHAIASNEKTELLYKIFITAAVDFALNENYGLDKYLSAEVRHTVFLTQLRSCFEKTMLVTTKKNDEYQSNEYWCTQYNYVNPMIVNKIDELLKNFSCEVDGILTSINNRFRVSVGYESNDSVFDFKAYHHRLVEISKIVSNSPTFDTFFNSLIKYMWSLAGESAKSAQKLVNEELKNKILEKTLSLEQEIQRVKGNVAMVNLMQEIKNSRSNFTKEIEIVLNWFRFVGADDLNDLERIGVVIEASVSSFESIYGHKDRYLEFTQSKSHLQLTYREARALFISIFTALDNAFKYSTQNFPVTLSHLSGVDHDVILIKNSVVTQFDNPQEFAASERSKWTEENSNLNTDEGGSGLYKIHSLLTSASAGFKFDIDAKRNNFTTIIRLQHEYFSNRR